MSEHDRLPEPIRRQRLAAIVPVTQPLLLCSQVQRSGGTLLTRLFDGHPGCFVHPAELRWGLGAWPDIDLATVTSPEQLFEAVVEPWVAKFASEGYGKHANAFARQGKADAGEWHPFLFDVGLQREIFAAIVEREPPRDHRGLLNAYLTSLFNGWLDYQNLYAGPKHAVVAFEPRFLRKGLLPFFERDYPDGLILSIIREPHGWLASYLPHTGYDVARCLRQWSEYTAASVRAFEQRPDRVVVILFDDLIAQTERVMRLLCDRIGLPFTEVLLQPTYNGQRVRSDSSYQPAYEIDRRVIGRADDRLAPAVTQAVAAALTPTYAALAERFALR